MLVLVTGAAGQLGLSLNHLVDQNKSNHQFIFATREHLDLSDFKFIRNFIKKNQFDVEEALSGKLREHFKAEYEQKIDEQSAIFNSEKEKLALEKEAFDKKKENENELFKF